MTSRATCETHGHIIGATGRCVFCDGPKAGEPTPPATPQPETPDPWVNALRTALDAVEQTIQQQAAQIETLTQALKGVKSIQRGYLCWCDGSWNNVEHGHQPKCQKATEAISGASRPTEGEQV